MNLNHNILSLFDGISCGKLALERAGIDFNHYYSSEIDKYCIECSDWNNNKIIRVGDINNWRKWPVDWHKIGIVLAGPPCQSWSVAGNMKGDNDPRGMLVYTVRDIIEHVRKFNPKVKFLIENVKMRNADVAKMNKIFGVEPILINSALVSAQNRLRLYWTNIENVPQPADKNIHMENIVAWSRSTRYRCDETGKVYSHKGPGRTRFVEQRERKNGKSHTLTTGSGCGSRSSMNYIEENGERRKLTPNECESLQTLPKDYTFMLSNAQRYKAIGNGWTVDVIAHILRGLK